MTPQEAIAFLKETIAGCKLTKDKQLREVCKKSISALEKQIPKKPNLSGAYHICPHCSRFVSKNEPKHGRIDIPHCKWCGQALDWGDNNAE